MAVKVLIVEDNPVARSFLCRVVRESFSDTIAITEAGDLETARRRVSATWPRAAFASSLLTISVMGMLQGVPSTSRMRSTTDR